MTTIPFLPGAPVIPIRYDPKNQRYYKGIAVLFHSLLIEVRFIGSDSVYYYWY